MVFQKLRSSYGGKEGRAILSTRRSLDVKSTVAGYLGAFDATGVACRWLYLNLKHEFRFKLARPCVDRKTLVLDNTDLWPVVVLDECRLCCNASARA